MAEAATSWAGGGQTLRKLVAQYRGIALVNRPKSPQSFTVRGTVARKCDENGEKLVDL